MQKARSVHAIAVVDVKVFCPPGETHSPSPLTTFWPLIFSIDKNIFAWLITI